MPDQFDDDQGLRDRIARQGEEALGKFAQDLLENPIINSAITRAFDAREKAAQAQEVAMGALNLPSAGDIERLTRRLRSVSQRLEGLEDGLDRIEDRLGATAAAAGSGGSGGAVEQRLAVIEDQLAAVTRELIALRRGLASEATVPTEQERLKVDG